MFLGRLANRRFYRQGPLILHQKHSSNPAPPFFLGAAACHGGVGGAIGPIASKEGRFYNRPGVVTQKAERDLDKNDGQTQTLFLTPLGRSEPVLVFRPLARTALSPVDHLT